MWALHEEIASRLAATLLAEKRVLENRLKQLKGGVEAERESSSTGRRPYPTVVPKFRNPGSAVRDVGGTRKDAALADREIEVRQADRRLPYQAGRVRGSVAGRLRRACTSANPRIGYVKSADAVPTCCGSEMHPRSGCSAWKALRRFGSTDGDADLKSDADVTVALQPVSILA